MFKNAALLLALVVLISVIAGADVVRPFTSEASFPGSNGQIVFSKTEGEDHAAHAPMEGGPVWSPDGSWIAYERLDVEGDDADGGNIELLISAPLTATLGDWQPLSVQLSPTGIPTPGPASFSCAEATVIPEAECEALVALYQSTDGRNWTNNSGWLDTGTPCTWYGVSCGDGHVRELWLNSNALNGTIPPELGDLADLRLLNLVVNELGGEIPPDLSSLGSLRTLDLSGNELGGTIPPELGRLAGLQTLFLAANKLGGSIPPELGDLANLELLNLEDNELGGTIPPELGDLANLKSLILWNNELSGAIPPELGDLANLESLALSGNELSGTIPPELGDLATLKFLFLRDNELGGTIPPALGDLANLKYLILPLNELSGEIPPELGDLANLAFLDLSGNELSGAIPRELGDLANLRELGLDLNELGGEIPAELGDLANLVFLDLSDNELSGTIPRELGDLANLRLLDLNNNSFTGALPHSLIKLRLTQFFFHETELCEPADDDFQSWLEGIPDLGRTGILCESAPTPGSLPPTGGTNSGRSSSQWPVIAVALGLLLVSSGVAVSYRAATGKRGR